MPNPKNSRLRPGPPGQAPSPLPALGSLLLGTLLAAAAPGLGGCARLGPSTLETERGNYNIAVQRTNDEQLLLNLVRLKYRDTPLFLEVTSVASQYTLTGNANANATARDQK